MSLDLVILPKCVELCGLCHHGRQFSCTTQATNFLPVAAAIWFSQPVWGFGLEVLS